MSDRTVRFIPSVATAQPAVAGVEQVVLDTSWTAGVGERSDIRSARPLIAAALRVHQPLADAKTLLDAWAEEASLVDRLTTDGGSHWYRRRIAYWRWLHDRLIWRWVLAELQAEGPIGRLEVSGDEPELAQVAGLLAGRAGASLAVHAPESVPVGSVRAAAPRAGPVGRLTARLGARGRRQALADRRTAVAARAAAIGDEGGAILVLTDPAVHQTVIADGATRRIDPFLGPVVEALRDAHAKPVVLELGARIADDATWAGLQADGAQRTLPGSVLADSCADPADDGVASAAAAGVAAGLSGSLPPIDVDGLDLGPTLASELRAWATTGLVSELRQALRIGRLLDLVRPGAVLMINEYSRPEWIVAARRRGVPSAAIQHGVIHPLHPGYIIPARSPALALVDRTYVFGDYESRLLTERSVYRAAEVRVTGAPRLDLVPAGTADPARRLAIRTALGVDPADRMVVFSSTSSTAVRRTVIAAAFDPLLDRAWPRVHLVVKLHPAEDDGNFYRGLIAGLAAARGFPPPPVSIVRDIDLFGLLASADAHLGVYSTVLTDAVAAGCPNLIVTNLMGSDLLGYVAAGVARPVQSGSELLAALEAPADAGATASRAAFLADHFAPGAAAGRIAADLAAGLKVGA